MIKKIGEKLELIHYLFFFLNSILYKKKKFKEKNLRFFLFGFNFVTFYKKKVYSTVVHIEQIPV